MILVNGTHRFRREASEERRLVPLDAAQKTVLLEAKAAALLSQLLKTINSGDRICALNGYRTPEEGSAYESAANETNSCFADPDTSEHQTDLAVDLSAYSGSGTMDCPVFPDSGICEIFLQNAFRFGFIERYGRNKQAVTGKAHIPWHFRYVGYPHSRVIRENDLCLEEYIAVIKDFQYGKNHLRVKQKKKLIEISYLAAEEAQTTFSLKNDAVYQISGNNADGFIITLWRNLL